MSRRKFALLNKTELEHSFVSKLRYVSEFKCSLNDLKKMLGTSINTIHYKVLLDDFTFFTLDDLLGDSKSNPDIVINWYIGAKDELSGTRAFLLLQQLALEKL